MRARRIPTVEYGVRLRGLESHQRAMARIILHAPVTRRGVLCEVCFEDRWVDCQPAIRNETLPATAAAHVCRNCGHGDRRETSSVTRKPCGPGKSGRPSRKGAPSNEPR